MIAVKDLTGLLPELFLFDDFVQDNERPDVEISNTFGDVDHGEVFTLFVDREPDIHTAHDDFKWLVDRRPNHVFLTASWSNSLPWPVKNVNFCSNILITARANQTIDPVDVTKKQYNGLCLFGGSSNVRNAMFRAMQEAKLLESCLVNIQRRYDQENNWISYQSPDIAKYDNPFFSKTAYGENNIFFTMHAVGDNIWLSQLLSRDLYNQCYIDVVTETGGLYPDLFYISEKLSKTLIAGMPFLVFGCCGFLNYFKDLGFQTYSRWLNEEYDNIEDNVSRALAIIESLKDFCSWPDNKKIDFFLESREVAMHNRQLALDYRYWLTPVVDLMKQLGK